MIQNKETKALDFITLHGLVRPKELEDLGISREHLRRLETKGLIEKVTRGVYRTSNVGVSGQCSLAEVSKRVPGCVICLFSALQFHEIGTELPGKVWIALHRGAWHPKIDYPPIETVTFSAALMKGGVAEHAIDGVNVKITTIARTVADCFKFRNKIGLDVAIESLKDVLMKKQCTSEELAEAARQCRVSRVIRPYIQALL
jgi:predicted transcriptional regulator of viral defense system